MPTNLPPEYYEAEERYNQATTVDEKITGLEALISTIPKHKGTDKLRANFRKRLSKLKSSTQSRKKTGISHSPYHIEKEGAGQIVLIGPTNVGKSSLLASLTNASPDVSDAPHTTWRPTPGMLQIDNVQVQVIDTPPLNRDYVDPELLNAIRRADLALVMVDVQTFPVEQLEETIDILKEHRIIPEHMREAYSDQLRKTVIPIIILANKCDDKACDEVFELFCELLEDDYPLLPISILNGRNIDEMKQMIFDQFEIIRVYTKAPGEEPDKTKPYVLKRGDTVADLARSIHKDFYDNLKAAKVWGSSAYDGQMVQRDFVLQDEDVVELRL
ncbi:MAG: 50S ribosome-binding GTPase [Anaerolineales bacterium]|nr:50S ribosome-binding GTPase [Anaerolineales bacterium]